jgi:SAM-dependent methyltransferase
VVSEQAVAEHYSHEALEREILYALTTLGADPEHLDPEQLAPVDEFHIGGLPTTVALVDQLGLRPGLRVLDVGSGLGGIARYLAHWHAVEVTGLDLTAEYVHVAESLSRRAGLAELVECRQGSATNLPFPDGAFDRVCMLHVGMNIADKVALFNEIRRVLVDGYQHPGRRSLPASTRDPSSPAGSPIRSGRVTRPCWVTGGSTASRS